MYSTATNTTPSVLTLSTLQDMVSKMKAAMGSAPELVGGATTLHENSLATRIEPVKKHKHRHAQTEAYHKRIQKKWTKRYGTRQVPCAYMIDNTYLGGFGHTLVAHPSLMAGLR